LKEKEEFWWVLIGDMKINKLYAIKRVNFSAKTKVELKFLAPNAGEHDLTLYCICDSYVGCDQVKIFWLVFKIFKLIFKGRKNETICCRRY